MPYWDEPRFNDPDEVGGTGDVTLPGTLHHMQAKAELNILVREGALTDDEAEEAMMDWRAGKELGDDRRLRAAVDELESRDLLDSDEAQGIREEIAG